jgi:hypothetical protein
VLDVSTKVKTDDTEEDSPTDGAVTSSVE